MSEPTQLDSGLRAIAARQQLAESELLLKELKAHLTTVAEGSNKEARDGWVVGQLQDNPLHAVIRGLRAEAEMHAELVLYFRALQRDRLIEALGGGTTDDAALMKLALERAREDPWVAAILDDEEVLGNEQEGLR